MGNAGWRGWTGRKGESATDGKDMEGERKGRAGLVRIDWGEAVCKILLKELIEFGLCTLDFKRTIF